ncbi:TldD/PmbA family protein [Gluconobacter frateurii]|uniref:Zinc-dependent microcin-processing U62/PmbA/TldD n=1 Tax=Gluconobacter frateurii NRIC 0228 TaxID=1307946 RepID=A0ABQ0QA56_9PROT|nr:TldD/PmbA family protein [Gluconobacter frateurii]GBR10590.1 zinc-dependent microcin-processing U62/PmbA/TldD [Gluconobacter frateurii NRIC 0228]GLP91527.1 modulator protein [Gluconobacter frateurii]
MSTTRHVEALLAAAKRHGADHADAIFIRNESESAMVRKGVPEGIERSESVALGLRVFRGQKAASVSTSVLDDAEFDRLAEQACAMALVVPEDRFGGLAPDAMIGHFDAAGLDLADTASPDMDILLSRAREAEEAALAVSGVTNTNGASVGHGRTVIALGTSAGFMGSYSRTGHSISASVLAGEAASMQRDYAYHSTVHLEDLDAPETIGRLAGERAVARINPGRPRTGTYDVIYDPRVSSSLVGHLVSAINGASIARGTSFLKEAMGTRILNAGLTVRDNPRLVRGLASRPFDGEGCAAEALDLVTDGVLQTWLLDSRSARQLGLRSNGRASRGVSGPPSPSVTNLHLAPGDLSAVELRSDIKEGILVTELMGSSVNMLTGDYSRGASGFMIRNGEIAEPVAELTIAGNLRDMFIRMVPASDLSFRSSVNAPSIRIDGMSIAGL